MDQHLGSSAVEEPAKQPSANDKAPQEVKGEIEFNPRFQLGHPHLQIQWVALEKSKRAHIMKAIVLGIVLVAIAAYSAPYFYHLIPLVCLALGVFRYNRWRKAGVQLESREKLLRAASWSLQDGQNAQVKYTVEDMTESSIPCTSHSVPNARVLVDATSSVPKYCGSWPVRNWKTLSEEERANLHCDLRTYTRAKVYHGTQQSFALVTDTGVVLWFV